MVKPLSRAKAEAMLKAPRADRGEALRRLPSDVDPVLAAEVALELAGGASWWHFARACRGLPEPVVREVLARLEGRRSAWPVFVRECVRLSRDGVPLGQSWAEALGAILDLESTYAWGSSQKRRKLAALAADARFLGACQAAAVACEPERAEVLAVLAIDASEASIDALLPHLAGATEKNDRRLDVLERLRTYARDTPTMRQMMAQVEEHLRARNAGSPALALAEPMGLGAVDELWFWAFVGSREQTSGNVPRWQLNLTVDSRSEDWFSVHVSKLPAHGYDNGHLGTSFNQSKVYRDELGVGRCSAPELPDWLARVARQKRLSWRFDEMGLRTGLRGRRRDKLAAWISGEG